MSVAGLCLFWFLKSCNWNEDKPVETGKELHHIKEEVLIGRQRKNRRHGSGG